MKLGVHSSLHPNCHHQVVFAQFNLSILHPPPHERTVRFFEKADPELIRRAADEFKGALMQIFKICQYLRLHVKILS